MTHKTRKLISFDWAIKKILRSKANFAILEGFLSELLFDDIKITDILESEANKNTIDDKFNRIDIKVKNAKDEIVLIEIQYNRELDYLQRMLYGSSKVIIEHIKESEPYAKIVNVISINILYFDLGIGDDYIYKGTTSFIGLHNHSQLKLDNFQTELYKTDKVEMIYPEYYLIKVNNFNDIAKDSLDQWIYFLKNEAVKDNFNAKGLDKAKEVLDYLKYSEEEKREYEYYKESLHYQASMYESTYIVGRMEGKIEGKLEGEKIGIAKGEQIGKIITLQENIAEILTIRFQIVPDTVKTKISAINKVSKLNTLLKKAMTTSSINDLFDS
jgi:predicted transposase/invertase (TIGR01784 family)